MHVPTTLSLTFVALAVVSPAFNLSVAGTTNCVPVAITEQPEFLTVLENCPARFTVSVVGTAPYTYQWFRDGLPMPDGTNSSYTIPQVSMADNGVRIHTTIANACSEAISSAGMIFVSLDVVPPRLLRARGDASLEQVIVTFGTGGCGGFPGLDRTSAEDPFKYRLSDGIIVTDAHLEPNSTNVVLTTSRQTPNRLYRLQVEGVSDSMGNVIAPWSEATVQSWMVLPGPDARVVAPPLTFAREGNVLWITWPFGSFLQSATDLAGPWETLLNIDFPYRLTTDESARFFRALFDP